MSPPRHGRIGWLFCLFTLALSSTGFAALTAHYRLDETSGTIINAAVGPSGSLAGTGSTWVSGQITKALNLDGNGNGYVEDDAALDGDGTNSNITISFWVNKADVAQVANAVFIQKGFAGARTYSFQLQSTDGIQFVRERAQGGSYTRTGPASIVADTWYHVVGVYNRNQPVLDVTAQNNMQLFVDGVSQGTRSSSGNLSNNVARFTLGAQDAGAGAFNQRFVGKIDDVGVWNECLTFGEIAALNALGRFEGLELSSPQIDQFVNAFANQGSITIGANNWHYATGLGSTTIGTTGGSAGADAYVVMDSNGNGMMIGAGAAPTLTTVATLSGATEDTPYTITYAALAAAADEADADSSPLYFRASRYYGTLTKDGVPVVLNSTLLGPGESWVWTPKTNVCGSAVTAFLARAFDGVYQSFAVAVPVNVACVSDTPSLSYLDFNETATFDTQSSAGAQGWTQYKPEPVINYFGWTNTSYAGGTPGEAGGTFQRLPAEAAGYYADTDLGGVLGLDDSLSASGRLIFTNNVSFNANIYLGHFNTNGFAGLNSSFVGLLFNENSVTNLRVYAYMRLQDGTVRTSSSSTALLTNIAYFDYNYDPNGNSGLGQLVVNLRNSGSNVIATQTLNLFAGDRDTGAQLNSWGASEGALPYGVNTIDMFWDNVSYTRTPQPAPAPSDLSYTALYPPIAVASPTMIVRDGDNSLSSATVRVSGNYQSGQDLLVYTQVGNIAGAWNSGNGTLTLSGSDTVANYQTALWTVKYQNTSATPSLLTRTISFKANDGTTDTATLTRNILLSTPPAGFNILTLTSLSSSGTAVFGFVGGVGFKYSLDWSTNLANPGWVAVITNTAPPSGVLSYTNSSSAPQNFYRTRLVP
jgi:hypothetical protein